MTCVWGTMHGARCIHPGMTPPHNPLPHLQSNAEQQANELQKRWMLAKQELLSQHG